MGTDLAGNGKTDFGITGGKNNLCVMDGSDTSSRLNLNSFELNSTFDHNANKSWHVFDVVNGATLTVSGGVTADGTMVVNFKNINSNVYVINVSLGGTNYYSWYYHYYNC